MNVPRLVPSLCHSSRPKAGVDAVNSRVGVVENSPAAGRIPPGEEEPGPGTLSCT